MYVCMYIYIYIYIYIYTTTLFLVCKEIIFSFSHVDSGARVLQALHCTAYRVQPKATQTRSVNTLNAQITAFRCNDSSGRDLFAVI